MKIARYMVDGRETVGLVANGGLIDAGRRLGGNSPGRFLTPEGLAALSGLTTQPVDHQMDKITLLPPVWPASKVFGALLNYESSRLAHGRPKLQYPHLTTRFPDTHVGHGMPLVRPSATREFDYEGEIAVVIGEGGRNIPAKDALAAVAGITCYNDATPRDWMRHSRHFTAAKNFPATASIGPWIATLDGLGELAAAGLHTRLNGEQVQHGLLGDLTFPVSELVAYISRFTRLGPGDVIATGTPAGAGYKRAPPRFLVAGDVVEVEVDGVGVLSNPVADE